ncbi:uncharacterized protein LOC123466377 isoform X4 [Daphnia magna]|uniref:uncharacterized protein LOC123466377 isoform X3 n=1 Tax=Daphnia magna TaxID=35525 RepID=UPI001E1BA2EE|nr:uncharacterized protein LOC123466377 isoform X3 [Daphnia magna]XP_045027740.1 uncharacterized protein LOC123466377 isoform X4 [Daphnia magna]
MLMYWSSRWNVSGLRETRVGPVFSSSYISTLLVGLALQDAANSLPAFDVVICSRMHQVDSVPYVLSWWVCRSSCWKCGIRVALCRCSSIDLLWRLSADVSLWVWCHVHRRLATACGGLIELYVSRLQVFCWERGMLIQLFGVCGVRLLLHTVQFPLLLSWFAVANCCRHIVMAPSWDRIG